MRVLFVHRYFHPDSSSTAQFLSDLAFHLAANGFTVTVLASDRRRDDAATRLPATETAFGVRVVRIGDGRFGRWGYFGRVLDDLVFDALAARRLLALATEQDALVALSDPPLLGVACAWVAKRRGVRLVHWLHVLFPESAAATGPRLPGFVVKALARLRDRALRRASLNVAVGEAIAERVVEAGVADTRVEVIRNWGLSPVDAAGGSRHALGAGLRKEWGLAGRFVVGYAGHLGREHDAESLLAGIEGAAGGGKDAPMWLFVGGGPGMAWLRGSVPMRALDAVRFEEYQPLSRLADVLAVPDVHLVSLAPAAEGAVYPNKLAGVLAAGKPVLFVGQKDGEYGTLVDREQCGMAVQSGDPEGLLFALRVMRGSAEMRETMGARARETYERFFARGTALAAWAERLQGVGRGE